MKISLSVILIFIFFASCKSDVKEERIETVSTIYFQSDSLHAIVFKPNHRIEFQSEDTSMSILEMWPILSNEGWVPSKSKLLSFKKSFTQYWERAKNDSLADLNNLTLVNWRNIDLLDYQVVGYIDSSNSKRMFINIGNWDALDMATSDWKKDWIIINDGGGTYHSIYNADTDSIELLDFN